MAKFTSGPWGLIKSGSFGWIITGNWRGEAEFMLARVDSGICEIKGEFFDENRANAVLMAASPQLLAAAKTALSNLNRRTETRATWKQRDQDAWEALDAAIKAAEG